MTRGKGFEQSFMSTLKRSDAQETRAFLRLGSCLDLHFA